MFKNALSPLHKPFGNPWIQVKNYALKSSKEELSAVDKNDWKEAVVKVVETGLKGLLGPPKALARARDSPAP